MISRAEQREIGWRFNFSKTQWTAIRNAVSCCGAGWTRAFSHRLLMTANTYLDTVSGKISWRPRAKQAAAWAKVASRMADARRALVDAEEESEPMLWVHARMLDHEGPDPFPTEYLGVRGCGAFSDSGPAVHRRVLALLEQWERSAAVLHACFTEREMRWSLVEREHPRMAFYRDVLTCWTGAGGTLRYSRHPTSHALQGVLVRYLQAVTQPVMGDDAPKLETIRSLIDREKKLRARAAQALVTFAREGAKSHHN